MKLEEKEQLKKKKNTNKWGSTILKRLGMVILFVIVLSFGGNYFLKQKGEMTETNIECKINNETYTYKIEYDKNNIIRMAGGSTFIEEKINAKTYNKAASLIKAIEEYFKENQGTCTFK